MIYQIKRDNVVIFQHEIKGNRTQSAPAVDFVDIEFDYYEAILLKRNDTIEFKGQTYYCDSQFNNIFKKSSNNYQHRARFLSEKYRATEIAVLDPNGVSEFEIEGNLLTLLTLAVDNLNRISSGWSYTTPPTTVTKLFQISEENVMSFLTKMSGEFEIPFEINDKIITFAYPAHTDAGAFEYGKGKGFLDLKKSYRSGEKIPNTIYATGGDGLTLDSPIIDQSSIDINGVIEGFYSNDDIKPTTRAMMTGVVTVNNVVATTEINYDLNAYKINGQTPIINFETGALAGLSFYIDKFEFDIPTNVSLIYIKHRTVDGALMPNNTVRPLAGDFFNITGITQPPQIILEAKNKLYSEASTFLYNGILRNLVLEANLDPLYAEDLKLNNEIFVNDVNLDINGFFIINEIREYLQDLQRKEIKVDYIGRNFLYTINGERVKLKVKNDNIIELGIQNNYDDLVSAQDELIAIGDELTYIGDEVAVIEAELPSKESKDNKVDTLTPEITTPELYPTVIAVNDGLATKQNTLTAGSNITIDPITNTISSTTSSQEYIPITSSGESVVIDSNNTIVNISNFTNTTISGGNNTGDLLTIASGNSSTKDVFLNYVDKNGTLLTALGVTDGKTFNFVWDGKWIDIT